MLDSSVVEPGGISVVVLVEVPPVKVPVSVVEVLLVVVEPLVGTVVDAFVVVEDPVDAGSVLTGGSAGRHACARSAATASVCRGG